MIPIGQIPQMNHGHSARADLHVGDRAFAGPNAVQPITMMPWRFVQVNVFFPQRLLDDAVGFARENAAIDMEFSRSAGEDAAAWTAVSHHYAVGINVFDAAGRFGVFGRMDLDRPRLIHTKRPLSDIIMMSAHVGVSATGVFAVTAPRREMIMNAARAQRGIVKPRRSCSKPHVPVEAGLHLFRGEIAPFAGSADAHCDSLDFAEASAADDLDSFAKLAKDVRALLTAGLQDAAMLAHGIDAAFRLSNRVRQWFLAVNVFASLASLNEGNGVPVVRRGDHDSINVFAGEQLAEVRIFGAALPSRVFGISRLDSFLCVSAAVLVHLADSHCLDVAELQQRAQVKIIRHLAAADKANNGSLAGRGLVLGAKNGARHNGRHSDRYSSHAFEEMTPGDMRNSFHSRTINLSAVDDMVDFRAGYLPELLMQEFIPSKESSMNTVEGLRKINVGTLRNSNPCCTFCAACADSKLTLAGMVTISNIELRS